MRRAGFLACTPILLLLAACFAGNAWGHAGHAHPVYGPPAPDWAWGTSTQQRDAAVADRNARGQQRFEAALAAAPAERRGRCEDTAEFDGIGAGCRTSDGLLRLELPGGGTSLVHGPDYLERAEDHDPATLPTNVVAALRGASRDDVACVAASVRRTRLVYAIPPDGIDRSATVIPALRQAAYELSAVLDAESRTLSPSAGRRLPMACDANGEPIVDVYRLRTPSGSASFATVQADLHALAGTTAGNGLGRWLVYYDHHLGSFSGIGEYVGDTQAGAANANNDGGRVALQDNSTGRAAPDWEVLLHEAAHNMGAVQDGAPDANGLAHCNDGLDVMCYEEGLGTYVSTQCSLLHFDCDSDSYYHPAPAAGSYLAGAWNLASPANAYLAAWAAPQDTMPPTAPTGLVAQGGGSFVRLAWNASSDAGGSGVHAYRVYLVEGGNLVPVGDSWPGDTTVDASWDTIAPSTSYTLRLVAYDERGNESAPAQVTVNSGSGGLTRLVGGTLEPPTDVHVSAATSSSVTLAWQRPIAGSGVYFRLQRRPTGSTNWTNWATTYNASYAWGATMSPGAQYDFRVTAEDTQGRVSTPVLLSGWTLGSGDVTAPAAPGNLRVASSSGPTPTIAWDAPADAVSYVVSVEGASGTWSQVATTTSLSQMVGGQTWGTTRTIGVASRDAAGNVSGRSTVSFTAPPAPDTVRPSTPSPSLVSRTTTSITVSWNAATDNVGVVGYRVWVANASVDHFLLGATTDAATRTAAVTGLQPGTLHWIWIEAIDAAGNGSARGSSSGWSTTADTTAPTMPTGLVATGQTMSSVTLDWNASSDASGVGSYRVFRQVSGSWTQIGTTTAGTTSFVAEGLSAATTYTFGVRAVDVANNESGMASVTTVTAADVPDTLAPTQPLGLAAGSITGTGAALTWDPSTDDRGVAGYRVRRGGVLVGSPSTTGHVVSSLTPATTYTFTVTAVDAAGNESGAASVTFTTQDTLAPSAPGSLAASGTTGTGTTLTWTAATDNVGVVGYRVTQTSPGPIVLATTTGLSHAVTGLQEGATYSFAVAAMDAAGNETASTVTVTTPDTTAPAAPGAITLGTVTGTTASLGWGAASDNVAVTGYRVRRDGVLVGSPTTTSYGASSLTPATTYTFTVTAVDAAGNESSAASVDVTTPDTLAPSAPGSLTATATSATTATLAWTAATDNVGVVGYRVTQSSPGPLLLTTTTGVSYDVGALQEGATYSFAVTAMDAAGNETTATVTFTAPDQTAPSQPGTIGVGTVTGTSVALSWAAATDNVAVTGYRVTRQAPDPDPTPVATPAGRSATIGSLTSGVSYTFAVAAIDAAGNVGAARTITVTTLDTIDPSTPSGFTATATGETSVHLAWDAASDNVAVAGYRVLRVVGGVASEEASTQQLEHDLTGLAAATTYRFQVEAFDAAGRSSARATVDVTTPDLTAPSVPASLATTSVSDTAIAFTWTAASDAVGVTAYRIYRTAPIASATPIATVDDATSYLATGLAADTDHAFEVTAVDAAGNESGAAQLTARTAAEPDTIAPTAPGGVTASDVTQTTATITWTAATDAGGVASYRVERLVGSTWTLVATGTTTSFAATGLAPGTSTSWRVVALDAAGNASTASSTLTFTTQSAGDTLAPTAPGGPIQASATTTGTVGLAWGASFDAVGVTGYDVYHLRAGLWQLVASSPGTSATIGGLAVGTHHSFAVAARDAAGNASARTSVDVFVPSPLRAAPGTPVALAATSTMHAITLSWQVPAGEAPTTWTVTVLRNGVAIDARTLTVTSTTFGPYLAGTALSFSVVASGPTGTSAPATISAATRRDTVRPTRPLRPRVFARGRGRVAVAWRPARDNVRIARYELRVTSPRIRGRVIRLRAGARATTVTRLRRGRIYSFTIRAVDTSGNASAWSLPARLRVR